MKPQLDMIGLVVKDMDESIRFYRALGLEIEDPDGGPYHQVILESGVRISWNKVEMMRDIDPDWEAPVGQPMALGFLCESTAAVDQVYRSVVDQGFTGYKEPWDAFWGQRYAQLKDPDGSIVDLFAPLS